MDVLLDIPPARITQVLDETFTLEPNIENDPGIRVLAALLFCLNSAAIGISKDFKWHRLPPFMGWGSKCRWEDCQPRVRSALLQRIDIVRNNQTDTSMYFELPCLNSAAIGRAFRRLPDLKDDLMGYNNLDFATQEAWEHACRDVILEQPDGIVSGVFVRRTSTSDTEWEWWRKVVDIATQMKSPRRKRCPSCRKRSVLSELFNEAQLAEHMAAEHPPLCDAKAWVAGLNFAGTFLCPFCPTKLHAAARITEHLLSAHRYSEVFPSVYKLPLAQNADISLVGPMTRAEWEAMQSESDHYIQFLAGPKTSEVTVKREPDEVEPDSSRVRRRRKTH